VYLWCSRVSWRRCQSQLSCWWSCTVRACWWRLLQHCRGIQVTRVSIDSYNGSSLELLRVLEHSYFDTRVLETFRFRLPVLLRLQPFRFFCEVSNSNVHFCCSLNCRVADMFAMIAYQCLRLLHEIAQCIMICFSQVTYSINTRSLAWE